MNTSHFRARGPRVGRHLVGGLALALLSGLAACGDAEAGNGGAEIQIAIATYDPTGMGGNDALLEGELVDREGCLVIRDTFGQDVLPVWPANQVSVAGSGGGLDLLGRSYSLGDPIAVGGGFAERWDEPVPDACRALGLDAFIVSPG